MSMQYGHWVVSATATAISSLYFTGMAPSATDNLSNAQKAFITSGASSFTFLSLARFSLLYTGLVGFSLELLNPAKDCELILGSGWEQRPPPGTLIRVADKTS